MDEKTLFVVRINNAKRDGYIEYLMRATGKQAAVRHFATARKASAADVERLMAAGAKVEEAS